MEIMIKNGNTGDIASVDVKKRLQVNSISLSRYELASFEGRAFNLNTGQYTINGGAERGVIYVKNTADTPVALEAWFFSVDNLVGTQTQTPVWKAYYNPTGGTLIDSGVDISPVNRSGGSSESFGDIICKRGADGNSTVTTTADPVLLQTQGSGRAFGNVFLTLPKNASVAITTNLYNDGSALVYAGFTGFFFD
jgi:hypothetical protein